MFDCWTLLHEMDDYAMVSRVYGTVVRIEMGYRGLNSSPADVLMDTIKSCICIIGRSGIRVEDYQHFLTGITAIQGHIFNGRINGENAGIMACEVMYLATCLFAEKKEFQQIVAPERYRSVVYKMKGMKRINYIRNVDPLAYAYLAESFKILQAFGFFTDSIL